MMLSHFEQVARSEIVEVETIQCTIVHLASRFVHETVAMTSHPYLIERETSGFHFPSNSELTVALDVSCGLIGDGTTPLCPFACSNQHQPTCTMIPIGMVPL